jgi:hypothetical protein
MGGQNKKPSYIGEQYNNNGRFENVFSKIEQ